MIRSMDLSGKGIFSAAPSISFTHLNEGFAAQGTGIVTFDMNIFDRWGNLIFASKDMTKGWDGKVDGDYSLKRDGAMLPRKMFMCALLTIQRSASP